MALNEFNKKTEQEKEDAKIRVLNTRFKLHLSKERPKYSV